MPVSIASSGTASSTVLDELQDDGVELPIAEIVGLGERSAFSTIALGTD